MIDVIERPESQRYWVVRAQDGNYIDHFQQAGTVAIGHLDDLDLPHSNHQPFFPEVSSLLSQISSLERRKREEGYIARSQRRCAQVKTFVDDLSVGDLVVSIDSESLMVGRIVGHPRINNIPVRVILDKKTGVYTEMPFSLRRSVRWGPKIRKKHVPTAMKRSISARQTVFNIDSYWTTIYYMLYPIFVSEGKLFFSTSINQSDAINNYSVSQLFSILTDLEVLTRSIDVTENPREISFQRLFDQFLKEDSFKLATTAEFMSPGSVWSYLGVDDNTGQKIILGSLLFGALFGVKIGPLEVDGIVHKELREKIVEEFTERLEHHNAKSMKKKLELSFPEFDTEPLENNEYDEAEDFRQLTLFQET
ncbi:hypothetical protein [Halomonas sp. PR-M31]|uniref:hypothetical protein n=1 Tax=Halomonas sp. PR-M31 TaxID=1471202 RepID=UPI000A959D0D|nr:hypothetical protein [Halomonas sp. PR-M31]